MVIDQTKPEVRMKDTQSTYIHLKALLEFGPRPLGSHANQAAADYIRDCFLSLNYQVEEQEYSCTAFDHAGANLYVDGQLHFR
jgi:hypothetical protein